MQSVESDSFVHWYGMDYGVWNNKYLIIIW